MGDNTVRSQMSIITTIPGLITPTLHLPATLSPGPIRFQSHGPTDRKNTIDSLPLSLSIVLPDRRFSIRTLVRLAPSES